MEAVSSVTPMKVLNIRLNWRIGVKSRLPQWGQLIARSARKASISGSLMAAACAGSSPWRSSQSSMSLSARWRVLHARQSISGSEKPPRWPEASHTRGFIRMALSSPTTSGRSCTKCFHHGVLMLFFSSTPSGP